MEAVPVPTVVTKVLNKSPTVQCNKSRTNSRNSKPSTNNRKNIKLSTNNRNNIKLSTNNRNNNKSCITNRNSKSLTNSRNTKSLTVQCNIPLHSLVGDVVRTTLLPLVHPVKVTVTEDKVKCRLDTETKETTTEVLPSVDTNAFRRAVITVWAALPMAVDTEATPEAATDTEATPEAATDTEATPEAASDTDQTPFLDRLLRFLKL
jgi:hypothetical protein